MLEEKHRGRQGDSLVLQANMDASIMGSEAGDIESMEGNTIEALESLFESPSNLGSATPDEWYELLKNSGLDPKPLGDGSIDGVAFEHGGGYRVNWGGDRIFQYHPAGQNHHGDVEYYKISSGITGKLWFDIKGNPLPR